MEETKTYELGLLLTPLLTEEGVAALLTTGALKQLFVRQGLELSSADAPKMIPLAYTIRKRIDNKNQVFREAYFASLRFAAAPEAIPELTAQLRKSGEVIRSLVISLPKITEPAQDRRPLSAVKPEVPSPENETVIVADKKGVIDREIDDLLAATTSN